MIAGEKANQASAAFDDFRTTRRLTATVVMALPPRIYSSLHRDRCRDGSLCGECRAKPKVGARAAPAAGNACPPFDDFKSFVFQQQRRGVETVNAGSGPSHRRQRGNDAALICVASSAVPLPHESQGVAGRQVRRDISVVSTRSCL